MSDLSGDALAASLIAGAGAGAGATGGAKKGKLGTLMPTIGAVALLSVIAIGGGAGMGLLLGGGEEKPAPAAGAETQAPTPLAKPAESDPRGPTVVLKLPPVVTNVSSPPKVLLRVEASIVFHEKEVEKPELLAAEIQSDMLVFLRTLELPQVEGARGLLHLREDLTERAQLRSPAIEDLLIQSLVVQ